MIAPNLMIDLTKPLVPELDVPEPFKGGGNILDNNGIIDWWLRNQFDGITYTVGLYAYHFPLRHVIVACREFDNTQLYGDQRFRQCKGSHMKFYVAVRKDQAIITSANLVRPTLNEIGYLITNKSDVQRLRRYFNLTWKSLQ